MSIIHVNQIKSHITMLFQGKIDLTDLKGKVDENVFLSRALAAYAIHHLADVEPSIAAASVTDGSDDNGIDAVFFNEPEKKLYLVQSKWIHDGQAEPPSGEVGKFAHGVKDLFNLTFERFNAKVTSKRAAIESAVNDSESTFTLVVIYTGMNGLAEHSLRILNDLKDEMNDPSELVDSVVLKQAQIHISLATALSGEPIKLDIGIKHWGKIEAPFEAYYGQVNGSEVSSWWAKFGNRLFAKNLRSVLGDTEVNEDMKQTIAKHPQHFWYFNNGVTLVANKITKTMLGGGDRDFGTFCCEDVSIVNGAQTVSSLGKAITAQKDNLEKAAIHIRVLSLASCPADFGAQVTKYNNRQNKIENRDFVSQDAEQMRIKTELAIDGYDYSIMRSGSYSPSQKAFDLVESTTSLATASRKSHLVVQLKREIGKLWENIDKAPYKELFNPTISGLYVRRCVDIQRAIDASIIKIAKQTWGSGRDYGLAVHGNRVIALLVFLTIDPAYLGGSDTTDDAALIADIEKRTKQAYETLKTSVNSLYPSAILPTLFKNAKKCSELVSVITQPK